MTDEARYPVVYQAAEGAYAVVRMRHASQEGAAVAFREDCDYGRAVVGRLRLPRWLYGELGKPRRLTVMVAAGPAVGRTTPLFSEPGA